MRRAPLLSHEMLLSLLHPYLLPAKGNAVLPDFLHSLPGKFRDVGFLPDLAKGFLCLFLHGLLGFCRFQFQDDTRRAILQGEEGDIEAAVAGFAVGLYAITPLKKDTESQEQSMIKGFRLRCIVIAHEIPQKF